MCIRDREYSTWTGSEESQTEFINEMNLPELLRNGLVQNNNSDSYQYLAVTTFSDYIAPVLSLIHIYHSAPDKETMAENETCKWFCERV